ncbi:hypothetical protein F3Y22_tig00001349pilonHSYRG00047 [Hibiscus syriacus]|uniref:Pentatricopeptide repeat-containing protein n=1 Tax=Hibiscus syriacus TaxID=106335 RepID=A0A6A3CXQ9_HIBSY|nr:hypothetical protein F3Y22_tig00001349pilonHSYRG00047 [Hibiscus syriacus]
MVTYTCLINGFCKVGEIERGEELFDGMIEEGANAFTYTTLITAFSDVNNFDKAIDLFDQVLTSECSPDVTVYHNLINGLCRIGHLDDADCLLSSLNKLASARTECAIMLFVIGLKSFIADLSWAQCGSSLFPINRRSILIVLLDREEDAESLRIEVKRLMVKVSELSSALERQEKEHNEINLELCLCKEQMKRETSLKIEASREKASIQQMLDSKSEVIVIKSNSECSRLEQRNMALAKELAVLKLVTDLDLEQDEMLKLASLGNEGNNQDVVDNLIRLKNEESVVEDGYQIEQNRN